MNFDHFHIVLTAAVGVIKQEQRVISVSLSVVNYCYTNTEQHFDCSSTVSALSSCVVSM